MENPPVLPHTPTDLTSDAALNPPAMVQQVKVDEPIKLGDTIVVPKQSPQPVLQQPPAATDRSIDLNPTFNGKPIVDLTPKLSEVVKNVAKKWIAQPLEKMGKDLRDGAIGIMFGFSQDGFLFKPYGDEVKPMLRPQDYKTIRDCAARTGSPVTERTITTEYDGNGDVKACIKLWEHKATSPDKPHVFYFTGRTGHIADTGVLPKGIGMNDPRVKGYDRAAGLKFLESLADKGYGFTAVTLRGYGGNQGVPGDKNFTHDIGILVKDLISKKQLPDNVIVAGYSMGTANAAKMAVELTRRARSGSCNPPAMLALANGFSSMIDRATQFANDHIQDLQKRNKFLSFVLEDAKLPRSKVKDDILNHPFDTESEIRKLAPTTHVVTAFSTLDDINPPSNSIRIDDVAQQSGLPHFIQAFEGYGHGNMPPVKLADYIDQQWQQIKRDKSAEQIALAGKNGYVANLASRTTGDKGQAL